MGRTIFLKPYNRRFCKVLEDDGTYKLGIVFPSKFLEGKSRNQATLVVPIFLPDEGKALINRNNLREVTDEEADAMLTKIECEDFRAFYKDAKAFPRKAPTYAW